MYSHVSRHRLINWVSFGSFDKQIGKRLISGKLLNKTKSVAIAIAPGSSRTTGWISNMGGWVEDKMAWLFIQSNMHIVRHPLIYSDQPGPYAVRRRGHANGIPRVDQTNKAPRRIPILSGVQKQEHGTCCDIVCLGAACYRPTSVTHTHTCSRSLKGRL